MIRYIKNTKDTDIIVGTATIVPDQLILLGSISGMFDASLTDIYYYLITEELSVYDSDGGEILERDDNFYQELLETIVQGKLVDFNSATTEEETRESALAYLYSTDWYVWRSVDPSSLEPIPEYVLILRAEARSILSS